MGYILFDGKYILIDDQAVVLSQSTIQDFDLPIIEGIEIEEFKIGEKINLSTDDILLTLDIISQIASQHDLFSSIDSINLMNLENIILKVKKLEVLIGNINNLSKKLSWLNEIYKDYSIGILDLSNIDSGEAVLTNLI